MDFADCLKVILTAMLSILFYKAFKPPHAPMDASQRNNNVKGGMQNRFWSHYMVISKATMQVLLGFAEITILILKNYPSLRLGHLAESVVLFTGGNASNVHLTSAHIVGALLMITGGAIRISAIKTLGNFFRFQVGIQKGHQLITHGLYSIVRHPAYMGMQMTHVGSLLWHLTPGSWVRESGVLNTTLGLTMMAAYFGFLISTFYMITITRMKQEDRVIQETFGKEWEEWARNVPYRVMPGIY